MSNTVPTGTSNSPEQVNYTDSMRAFADKFNELVAYINLGEVSSSLSQYIQEIVDDINASIADIQATGIPKLVSYQYSLPVIADGQTDFTVPLETFDVVTDTVIVIRNGRIVETKDYTIEVNIISLKDPVVDMATTDMAIMILKNVPIGPNGVVDANTALQDESVTEIKLAPNSVSEAKLKDGSVTTPKLAPKSVTKEKLADNIASKMDYINLSTTLYVDIVAGNDTNIGTVDYPLKTLAKASEIVSNKSGGEAHIYIREGTYPEKLMIQGFKGHLTVEGVGNVVIQPTLTTDWDSAVRFANVDNVILDKLRVAPICNKPNMPFYIVALSHIGTYFNMGYDLIIDGQYAPNTLANGCLAYASKGHFTGTAQYCYEALTADMYGEFAINNAYFEGCERHRALSGGSITVNSHYAGSQILEIANLEDRHALGAGLDVNLVAEGIIIESGSNINGKYIKYADGTLVCTGIITILLANVSTWNSKQVIMPHAMIDDQYRTSLQQLNADALVTGFNSYNHVAGAVTSAFIAGIHVNNQTALLNKSAYLDYICIGKWKA